MSVRRTFTGASQFTWTWAIWLPPKKSVRNAMFSFSPRTWLCPVADTATGLNGNT